MQRNRSKMGKEQLARLSNSSESVGQSALAMKLSLAVCRRFLNFKLFSPQNRSTLPRRPLPTPADPTRPSSPTQQPQPRPRFPRPPPRPLPL